MRRSIATAVAGLALLAVATLALALITAIDESQEEFIDRVLTQQITQSMKAWQTAPLNAFPNTPDMQLFRIPNGEGPPDAMPADVRGLALGIHEVIRDGREMHVAVRDDGEARYVLVFDVEESEARLGSIFTMIVAAGLLMAAFILVGSYLLAGRLAGRLERLAARVEAGDGEGLAEPSMERELLLLANALERSHARQEESLERERTFAENLSHELRTPLTAIRTDAELIAASVPESIRLRAERIMDRVDRIDALAASLLLLARDARPREAEEVDLQSTLAAVWESLRPAAAGEALQLKGMDGPLRIFGDPAFVELVLRNALDNALRHSPDGRVQCRLEGHELVIADSGPGFAAAELGRVFDRFYSGSGSHGLGLALVRHVCAASDWQVSARNGAAGGGEIVFDFGASLRRG
jgi:signal transduction histidine kinase